MGSAKRPRFGGTILRPVAGLPRTSASDHKVTISRKEEGEAVQGIWFAHAPERGVRDGRFSDENKRHIMKK